MNKKIVLIGGAAAVAVLLYLWWKNKSAAASTGVPSVTGSPSPLLGGDVQGNPVVSTVVNPVTQQSANTLLAANGTVEVPIAVQQWAATMGPGNQAQFMKMLPSMSGSDINNLYDIIINAWGKGAQPTQSQVSFWDDWRAKYHILDGTISNFTGKPKFSQYGKRK